MPKYWHDRHSANRIEDDKEREFCRKIVADKKPYFMRYIYPTLMKQYNQYIKNTDRNALREFQMTVRELKNIPRCDLTERQVEFLYYYEYRMPVGTGDCVMNKICRRFEDEFDGYIGKRAAVSTFDYRIMRGTEEYTSSQYYAIKHLYEDHKKQVQNYMIFSDYERVDKTESASEVETMGADFRASCEKICPSRDALCNIILDICYTKNSTKKFAWDVCADQIIHNLLQLNDHIIRFPVACPTGEVEFCGDQFEILEKRIGVDE